jgi:hypothetical protein
MDKSACLDNAHRPQEGVDGAVGHRNDRPQWFGPSGLASANPYAWNASDAHDPPSPGRDKQGGVRECHPSRRHYDGWRQSTSEIDDVFRVLAYRFSPHFVVVSGLSLANFSKNGYSPSPRNGMDHEAQPIHRNSISRQPNFPFSAAGPQRSSALTLTSAPRASGRRLRPPSALPA